MTRQTKKLTPRPCERCGALVDKLTRARLAADARWMICDGCWLALAPDNPHYTYGGVWRAAKRR